MNLITFLHLIEYDEQWMSNYFNELKFMDQNNCILVDHKIEYIQLQYETKMNKKN